MKTLTEIESDDNGRQVVEILRGIGMGATSTLTWLTSQSPWLDGAIPAELLESAPERVIEAARHFTSNA